MRARSGVCARWLAAVLCTIGLAGARPTAAVAAGNPIAAHSMVQLNAPFSFMQAMFAEAAGMHAGSIRLDIAPALVFPAPDQPPDYSGLDEVMTLAAEYHLRVVGDLLTIPWWIANCQPATGLSQMARCGTDDLTDYRSMITQIAAHAVLVIRDWEIWNEPDSSTFFSGTPAQYAQMLRAAHDAIKQVDPGADVLLGGMSGPGAMNWLGQVFAVPGADAAHAFDTANIHERGSLDVLGREVASWKQFLAGHGFTGPLWVTEHGYPADPAFQYDPSYRAGATSQATFLGASIPSMLDAGASAVFVTERDNLGGPFASEGVLGGAVTDPPAPEPQVAERPAYAVARELADCYVNLGRDCPGPAPAASPPVFAASRPGTSRSRSVAVSDPGLEPLQLGSVVIAGPPSADAFSVRNDSCSGRMLEPNQTCTVAVRFAPAAGGNAAATLQVPSDNGTLNVQLSGVSPSVSSLSPLLPVFAPVDGSYGVGHAQRITVQLTNPLRAPVKIAVTRLSGRHFELVADRCAGRALVPGATCRLVVRFTPTRLGSARAQLRVTGDGLPLAVPLVASAYRTPAVTTISQTAGCPCFSARTQNRVLVLTDQPATIEWQLRRLASTASRAGGRATARGRVRTSDRWMPMRGRRGYLALFPLPVAGGHRALAPGFYRLTVTAGNAHGRSPAATEAVAVLR